MAYHNAGREKYLGKDENAYGIADSPGDKKAKAASPEAKSGRAAETARPQASADMTGKQSMPDAKTNLKVSTVCVKGGGGAGGSIKNTSGDAYAYLGHFHNPEVLKRGHNQGAPGMLPSTAGGKMPPMAAPPMMGKAPAASPAESAFSPGAVKPPPTPGSAPFGSAGKAMGKAPTPSPMGKASGVGSLGSGVGSTAPSMGAPVTRPTTVRPLGGGVLRQPATVKPLGGSVNALTNPIAAARASNKAKLAATPAGGGARKEVKRVNKLNLGAAKEARQARNKEGFGKSDRAALKGLRKGNKAARRA